ncbi:MAG: LysM peptidoglycan-binding domain-containing protein [Nitrospinae bacterium]|nr:LysM peptidoglycan-binding domain-containing protein [Nitrospinota bacterium]
MFRKLSTVCVLSFWVAALFPLQAVLASSGPGSLGNDSARQELKTREIIHTVQEKESLGEIAKYFGIDPGLLAKLNNLENPDLIFPGHKLTIQVQSDFSLRVFDKRERAGPGVKDDKDPKQILLHVTHPSREDIFAPENPLAEMTETISGPRRSESTDSMVFKTFFDFVEWLVGEENIFKPTKAASSPNFDPSPNGPYTIPSRFDIPHILSGGIGIHSQDVLYQSHISDLLNPPPKAL